jgi:pimeloyl-ACP methyl ester carboxylesterase
VTTDRYGPGATLLLPAQPPRAWAIHAFRSAGPAAASAVPAALVAVGFGVLSVDLDSAGSSRDASAAEDRDAAAVRTSAEALRAGHGRPSLLVGQSGGGPAVLAAAAALSDARALVTVGSPAPRSGRGARLPLLVLHGPRDPVVPVEDAGRIFAAALHPKSFVALDGIDHAVSAPGQGRYVAGLIAAWAEPYLPDPPPPLGAAGPVVVTDDGVGRYSQRITAGRHLLTADEPASVGGADAGPTTCSSPRWARAPR